MLLRVSQMNSLYRPFPHHYNTNNGWEGNELSFFLWFN